MDFVRRFIFGNSQQDQRCSRRIPVKNDEDISNRPRALGEPFSRGGSNAFSDPLKMYEYYEEEFNKALQSFGWQNLMKSSSGIPNSPASEDLEPPKSGYKKHSQSKADKADKDLDDKAIPGDLDPVFKGALKKKIIPRDKQIQEKCFHGIMIPNKRKMPQNSYYRTTLMVETVVNPDGSIETCSTVRDNEGNQEIGFCRRIGDKECCLIGNRYKNGYEDMNIHLYQYR
nr:uncharacterized protein LOC111517135 [Leptinotarsa decemlineata]